jgi:hypothetical protein
MNTEYTNAWKLAAAILLGVALAFLLSAFFARSSQAALDPAADGWVTGVVTEAGSGILLSGVEICFYAYEGPYLGDFCMPTGEDGAYTKSLPEGVYVAWASKAGYAFEFYDETYNEENLISVTVSAGQTTAHIDFNLAPGGVITGVVTEAGSGNPLQGFHVELLCPNLIRSVSATNENGAYRFDAVPLDTGLHVFAWDWPDGGEHSLEFYDNASGWDTATQITLTAVMTTLANINFQLERLGVITETVVSTTTGGVIVNVDSQGTETTIAIPIGAVTETTTFVYTETPTFTGETPAGFSFAGSLFSLAAYQDDAPVDDYGFAAPITVTLRYTKAALGGIQEDSLKLMYWDEPQADWLDAACGAYDRHPDEDWLAVPICHLSDFALFGVAEYKVALPLVIR